MNRRSLKQWLIPFTVVLAGGGASIVVVAAPKPGTPPERAKAPQWTADDIATFFPDARTRLIGERPQYDEAPPPNRHGTTSPTTIAEAPVAGDQTGVAWSELVDADTIETEIKRIAGDVASKVTSPSQFKGGGYIECRRDFSMLGVLFAIVAEYDGAVRWHDAGGGLRDQFARAGRNARVGTDQTYREALACKQELEDLVRGARPQMSSGEEVSDWSQVAGRPPLMQRLQIAQQERLARWLASEREFNRHRDEVRHEAQLIAILAEVIARKDYEYWDDETYVDYTRALRDSAVAISTATEAEDYHQARQALDHATRACADCHDGYRG